jgi:hypothetical protein
MRRIKQQPKPSIGREEGQMVMSHCLWSLRDPATIQKLIDDSPSDYMEIVIEGASVGMAKGLPSNIAMKVHKSDAATILHAPEKIDCREYAAQVYAKVVRRVFAAKPRVTLNGKLLA